MVDDMCRKSWAESEVERALEGCHDANTRKCYESALKVYKFMLDDMLDEILTDSDWGFIRSILKDLMYEIPLKPIEGKDDEWLDLYSYGNCCKYQSNVYPYLFKDVYDDGRIVYTDINRTYCQDIHDNNNIFSSNWINSEIINSHFPITMPYLPSIEKIVAYVENFEYNDCIYTHIVSIQKGFQKYSIDRYFVNGKEITEKEWVIASDNNRFGR